MTQPYDKSSHQQGPERPFAGRLLQGMLITAIVVLIAIAVVSFN
jgi:hypothetical protein